MKRAVSASSVGMTKSRAAMVLPSPTSARHCATSSTPQPVQDRAVGFAPGQAQHARAQRAEQDGRPFDDGTRQFEAVDLEGLKDLVDLLAVQRALDESQHVAGSRVGLARRECRSSARRPAGWTRPSPMVNRPPATSAIAAMLMASSPGPRVKAGVTATPRLRRVSLSAATSERRETVGAVDLGGPHVGVAEVGESMEPLAMFEQRDAVKGDGDAVARGHELSVSDALDGSVNLEVVAGPSRRDLVAAALEVVHPSIDERLEHGHAGVVLALGGNQVPAGVLLVGRSRPCTAAPFRIRCALLAIAPVVGSEFPVLQRIVLSVVEAPELLLSRDVQPELHDGRARRW